MHTPTESHFWYQCSQSRNTIAASSAIPLQHCQQSCNTNVALQAIVQYQCSIACNRAITPEIAKKKFKKKLIFTPIAALLAIMQSQCNQPCTPSVSVYALTHSQCSQPCTPPELYCFNRMFQCMHSHTPSASIPALSNKNKYYYRLRNVAHRVIVFICFSSSLSIVSCVSILHMQ